MTARLYFCLSRQPPLRRPPPSLPPNRGKRSGTGRISNRPEHPYHLNEEMRSCVKPVIVHHAVFDSRTAVSHTRPAVFDISPKRRKKTAPAAIPLEQPAPEPDIRELEKKLNRLLENNSSAARIDNLQKELQTSKSNTVAAYIKLNKKDLKGFHLFQLIFR